MIEWFNVLTLAVALTAIVIAYVKKPVIDTYVEIKDEDKIVEILERTYERKMTDQVNEYLNKVFLSKETEGFGNTGYSSTGSYTYNFNPSIQEKLISSLVDHYSKSLDSIYPEPRMVQMIVESIFADKKDDLHKAIVNGINEDVLDEIISRIKRKQLD